MKSLKIKYKREINKLCKDGEILLNDIRYNLDNFKINYQTWYSAGLVVINLLLPSRLIDFEEYYYYDNTQPLSNSNYSVRNYLQGDSYGGVEAINFNSNGSMTRKDPHLLFKPVIILKIQQQLAIIKACKVSIDSALFNLEALMLGDLYVSELDAAIDLNKHKFTRAAGVIAGVVLERHLKKICEDHILKIEEQNPSIGYLDNLLYTNNVYSVQTKKHIELLGSLRNLCGHDKPEEPTKDKINMLIDGVRTIVHSVY